MCFILNDAVSWPLVISTMGEEGENADVELVDIFCVCAACLTPRLNLRFQLRPSWNIHHTVTDDPVSKQDRRYARQRNGQIYMSEE